MARTKDPHAATVKAWETRARAAGGGTAVQQRGDYLREGPRWQHKETWLNKAFQRVLNKLPKPVRDLVDEFLPSVQFDFNDPYQRGGYMRFVGSIRMGDASSDSDIVHEVGHAVDHALQVPGRVHPGPGLFEKKYTEFWSEKDRDFGQAFAEDVRQLKKKDDLYRDWEYAASKRQEGFSHSFQHLMGFPTEWGGGGEAKPGFARAFPKTLAVVRKKLKGEGLLPKER